MNEACSAGMLIAKVVLDTASPPSSPGCRQILHAAGRTQVYRGMMDCIRILWQQEGLAGFYKGLGPAMLKAVPNTMITFVVYDWAMAFVVGGDNNNDDDGGDAAS